MPLCLSQISHGIMRLNSGLSQWVNLWKLTVILLDHFVGKTRNFRLDPCLLFVKFKGDFFFLFLRQNVCAPSMLLYLVRKWKVCNFLINPLTPELNPICYMLALLAHHFIHVSRIRVKSLTLRLLMSYIYGAPILDVSRSHSTTQHSR